MKPPAEELERRRPVWEALSSVFLDTEIEDEWLERIAGTLRASGYTASELEAILWGELCPVLYPNLLGVAGEWDGFSMGYVEQQILSPPAGRLRQRWAYFCGGSMVRPAWRRIERAMAAGRAQSVPR